MTDYSDLFPDLPPDQANELITNQLKGVMSEKPATSPTNKGSPDSNLLPWLLGPALGGAAKVAGGLLAKTPAALYLVPFGSRLVTRNKDSFKVHDDETGKSVAFMTSRYNPETKDIHVLSLDSELNSPLKMNNKALMENHAAHSIGTANIKSLVQALRYQYPKAETVSASRQSGANPGFRTLKIDPNSDKPFIQGPKFPTPEPQQLLYRGGMLRPEVENMPMSDLQSHVDRIPSELHQNVRNLLTRTNQPLTHRYILNEAMNQGHNPFEPKLPGPVE